MYLVKWVAIANSILPFPSERTLLPSPRLCQFARINAPCQAYACQLEELPW